MTDFLYARPSVFEGIGRNIDLFGVLNTYNLSKTEKEADAMAYFNDILALGMDFENAYNKVLNGQHIQK